jgi:galactokinase
MGDYSITEGSIFGLADTKNFISVLDSHQRFFTSDKDVFVARAPGRLDVMGGIADYSGSLVLQLPINDATHVALQRNTDSKLSIRSLGSSPAEERNFEMDLREFITSDGNPIEFASARERFVKKDHWAAYVAGVFIVLMRERQFQFNEGARVLIASNVPEGKGVSSSAALEVSTMHAVVAAFDLEIEAPEIALLCQKVENLVAGAPCGIMDQMTSACGNEGQLLELLCQPSNLLGSLAIPAELELWGIDSGVRHSVGGSDYGTVRTAAFMGYRMIAATAEFEVTNESRPGKVRIADSRWNGYLANITTEEFEKKFLESIPVTMNGGEFLRQYDGITDNVTSVIADRNYPVSNATRHPIYEHSRVNTFGESLKNWNDVSDARQLGELMFQSHQSYSDCGLGSEATDLIVKLVKDSQGKDLFGARITGGGSGGTVAILGERGASPAIEKLVTRFQEITGYKPLIISGSSPGAGSFKYLRLNHSSA